MSKMNVVLNTEWNERFGGAENVNIQIIRCFREKPEIATIFSRNPEIKPTINSLLSKFTYLPKSILGLMSILHNLKPVPPNVDLLINSSFLFAHIKRIKGNKGFKIVYVHTPIRYVWLPKIDNRFGNLTQYLTGLIYLLRVLDKYKVDKNALYIANSEIVKTRIKNFWDIESIVINPPVDTEYFKDFASFEKPQQLTLISAGRLVSYKQHNLALMAARSLNAPIIIAGSGPQENELRNIAIKFNINASFITSPTREELAILIAGSSVMLHLAIEDFGILPVESMACGTPVVGFNAGGLIETVNSKTGVLVDEESQIMAAISQAASLDRKIVQSESMRFSNKRFIAEFSRALNTFTNNATMGILNE
jgi:glycosyltransferase involved in cell wall biosynthesis